MTHTSSRTRPKMGRPRTRGCQPITRLALPAEVCAALDALTSGACATGISARGLHALLDVEVQFSKWIERQDGRRRRDREPVASLLASKVCSPTGGRKSVDYRLTIAQAAFMVEHSKAPRAIFAEQALTILGAAALAQQANDVQAGTPSSYAFALRSGFSAPEYSELLGGIPGYPGTRRGWRKLLDREQRPLVDDGYPLRYAPTSEEAEAIRSRVVASIMTAEPV
mgnify:CR=1 FL=1